MKARLLLRSALLIATGCNAVPNGSTPTTQAPAATAQGLTRAAPGADDTCPGTDYPVCKDDRSPQMPQDDVALIDSLVPHHQAAVEMANMELQSGANEDLKTLAQTMLDTQTEEIEKLLRMREELAGCRTVTSYPDPMMDNQMAMMQDASGAALDLMFIDCMIPHHALALAFTHHALPNLQDPELNALALGVIDTQSEEIGEMHALRAQIPKQ